MKGFGPASFGEIYAEEYDREHDPGTTDEAVACLWELAGMGSTLELAIGTGRIALPLALRGLPIQGIDASPEMIAKLREKPGGASIPVVIGDFAEVGIEGPFDFAFLVFNTLFNLTTQADQVRCFQNVSRRLTDNGYFLVETMIPEVGLFSEGQSVRTRYIDRDSVTLEAAIHDPVTQTVQYQRVRVSARGIEVRPLPIRYAWPAEIDLMAQIAGLRLKSRWGGWDRSPFTADSRMHVSVYEKVAHKKDACEQAV